MKIRDQEITVANRFIYYYASFLKRIYGFVVRRDGGNIPDQHYIGRMRSPQSQPRRRSGRPHTPVSHEDEGLRRVDLLNLPSPQAGRWEGDPEPDEIVLFRYRKRLMLGRCQELLPRAVSAVSVASEDGRRLKFHKNNLVYLTGVRVLEDRSFLRTYAASVRALSAQIDLWEVWDLARDEETPLPIEEIASLYWDDEIDASRWIALYLHIDGVCPYFELEGGHTCVPLPQADAAHRRRQRAHRRDAEHEWEEFIQWLLDEEEPYAPETLTKRQQTWLEQVQQYALWATDAQGWKQARKILSETSTDGGDLQRHAFELLLRKGVWEGDGDLELLRAGIPFRFSEDAVRTAGEIGLSEILNARGRRKLRRRVFTVAAAHPDIPQLGISLRRRWWRRGYELGVHIPDIAALVPAGSALDREASDRMAALCLPDRDLPMLPAPITHDLGRLKTGLQRPAISILWNLDRNLVLKGARILPTTITVREELSSSNTETLCVDPKHPLRTIYKLAESLTSRRDVGGAEKPFGIPEIRIAVQNGEIHQQKIHPEDKGRRIVHELAILAAVEIGTYCTAHGLPAIYETQDPPERPDILQHIPHPVVRRHETRRQTPWAALSAVPGSHRRLGVSGLACVASPLTRYTDLLVQRQICHHLRCGEALYAQEDLDLIRYRAQEELREMHMLRSRQERHWVLKHLASQAGGVFPAVVLYIRRDGVLVELHDHPLKAVVRPQGPVDVGRHVQVRISGVDLWNAQIHATIV